MQRNASIDYLRGLAIISMIAVHTIFFRWGLNKDIFEIVFEFGNNFSFTTFIVCFGMGLYFFINSKSSRTEVQKKLLKRIFSLILTFYLIATFSFLYSNYYKLKPEEMLQMVVFLKAPIFTEYMLPFIIYTGFIYLLIRLFKSTTIKTIVKKYFLILLVAGVVLNFVGNYLYGWLNSVSLPNTLKVYVSLFFGSDKYFYFPIVQYLLVLFIGLYLGSILQDDKKNFLKNNYTILLISYTLFILVLVFKKSQEIYILESINTSIRFPPSLLFLLTTLSYSMFAFMILRLIRLPHIAHSVLKWLGRNSIAIVIFHIGFIFLMENLGFKKFTNIFVLGITYLFLLFGVFGIQLLIQYFKKLPIKIPHLKTNFLRNNLNKFFR